MHYSLNLDSRDRVDRGPEEGCAADSAEHNTTATTGATNGCEVPNRNTAVTPELRAPRYHDIDFSSVARLSRGRCGPWQRSRELMCGQGVAACTLDEMKLEIKD